MASRLTTIFTSAGGTDLQLAPTEWTLVSLSLETAGPVYAGTEQSLAPVGSGRGVAVGTTAKYFLLGPKDRLYTISSALNRVSMAVHPLPNLVQIVMKMDELIGSLAKKFGILR